MLLLGVLIVTNSLCAQCGPAVSPVTTAAIIQVESAGLPYAIGDNTTRRSHNPKTKAEAIILATELLAKGHNIDMGLMQVNSVHLKNGKIQLTDLFEPCSNIKAGTGILADFYRQFDREPNKNQVLFKALSAYNTGSAWRGPSYINKLLTAVKAPYRVNLREDLRANLKSAHPNEQRKTSVDGNEKRRKNEIFFDAEVGEGFKNESEHLKAR